MRGSERGLLAPRGPGACTPHPEVAPRPWAPLSLHPSPRKRSFRGGRIPGLRRGAPRTPGPWPGRPGARTGQDVGPGPAGLPGGVRVSHPRRGGSVVSRRNLPEHVRKQLENRGSAGLACESRRAARPPRGPPAPSVRRRPQTHGVRRRPGALPARPTFRDRDRGARCGLRVGASRTETASKVRVWVDPQRAFVTGLQRKENGCD